MKRLQLFILITTLAILSTQPAFANAPATPTGFTVIPISLTQNNLAWSSTTIGNGGHSSNILRCAGSGCTPVTSIASTGQSVTTYSDLTVSTGTTYGYRIQEVHTGSPSLSAIRYVIAKSLTEQIAISSTTNKVAQFNKSLIEQVIISTATNRITQYQKSLTEQITISDLITTITQHQISLTEIINISINQTTETQHHISLIENTSLLDNISKQTTFFIDLIEYVEPNDSIDKNGMFSISLFEYVEFSDNTSTLNIFFIILTESLNLNDEIITSNLPVPQNFVVYLDENIVLNDNVITTNSSPPQAFQINLIEELIILDDLITNNSPVGNFIIELYETITISDLLEINGILIIPPQPTEIRHKGFPLDNTPPTLGVNTKGVKFVTDGFTINGVSIDAEYFYTPMELQTLKVGVNNTIILKIYENNGAKDVERAIFCINIPLNDYVSDTTPCIMWKNTFDGIQSVSTIGSDIFNSISASGQMASYNMMVITINFIINEPQPPAKFGTSISDQSGNTWQNYFNHGIQVVVDPTQKPTEIFVKVEKSNLSDPPHVMFRNSDYFTDYKLKQEKKALETITEMYGTGIFQSFEYKFKSGMYEYHERNMTKLHQKMLKEEIKAIKLMKNKALNLQ